MARPICAAAGEEDQVTGEGLVLLDHDDVPNLQDRQTASVWRLRGAGASSSAGRCVDVRALQGRTVCRGILPKPWKDQVGVSMDQL